MGKGAYWLLKSSIQVSRGRVKQEIRLGYRKDDCIEGADAALRKTSTMA